MKINIRSNLLDVVYYLDKSRFSKYLTRTNILVKVLELIFFNDYIQKTFKNTKTRPGVFCRRPFEYAEIDIHGDVYICCPRRMNKCIGNLHKSTFFEIWNSDAAQAIRKSIFDGTYKYCIEEYCVYLMKNRLPKGVDICDEYLEGIIKTKQLVLNKGPKILNLGYDNSCNLSCPSCRSKTLVMPKPAIDRMTKMQDKILEVLDNTEDMLLSGHGDPFASPVYKKLMPSIDLIHYPKLKIKLITNGLLLTEKAWNKIENVHEALTEINVSIDAATENTYGILRRGGNFNKLMGNMSFLARLRQEDKIKFLRISFVVQKLNYTEMKSFIEMGLSYNCDHIAFSKISNWGTYSREEFIDIAIHNPEHPEHPEFLEYLKDPIFKDRRVVMNDLEIYV